MHIGNVEITSPLYLAPMAGVTDMAFRQICRELGAAMSCTELVSAKALCYQDKKSRTLLKLAPNEKPAAAQIFGSDIPCMAEAAVIAAEVSGADIIDINMGCPVGKVVANGDGSALMKDPEKAARLAEAVVKASPDINFIAVEMARNVIVSAMELAVKENLPNLKFLMGKAEYLEKFFPENSVERIYLNFSCPYPKETYKKHRLTHPVFLEIYKHILIPGGEIHQKTDNMKLFEFSIENLSQCGFKLKNVSLDLHNSGFEGNIVTEYEKRFSEQGFPIYRLEAVNPTK